MSHSAQIILIAGAGVAGLTLAVSLKQALGSGVDVIVYDPALPDLTGGSAPSAGGSLRVSALSADGRRLLEGLDVWSRVSARAQAIMEMEITDSALMDPVRAQLLSFEGEVTPGEPYAHMVVNRDLLLALVAVATEAGVELRGECVERWSQGDASAGSPGVARLSNGERREADLLVAADGARSRLRELAGIAWHGWGYAQSAIVATLTHERPHCGKAIQHFLPSGPFAILPLTGNRSSIVWTEETANVPGLMAMDRDDLLAEIRRRFGLKWGGLGLETFPVGVFPLGLGIARSFYGDGLALVGDAAHQVHPIAGQGLNLGLRDVAVLVEELVGAIRIGLPASDAGVLRAYDRRRRPDVVAMAATTDILNRLFSTDLPVVRLIRDLGARLVGRSPAIKRMLIREAAGIEGKGRG